MVEDIETDDNRKKAKELFQEEFCKYFGEKDISLEKAKEYIHAELMKTEKQRIDCIESLIKVKAIIGEGTSGKYILCIKNEISDIDRAISQLMGRMEYIKQYGEKLVRRCAEWRNSYNKLPWYVRMLKFISFFKKKIAAWSYENMEYDELDFLERGMNIDEIENAYKKRIHENDVSFKKIRGEIESFQTKKKRFVEKDTYIHELLHKTQDMFGMKFSAYNICINDQQFYEDFNILKN